MDNPLFLLLLNGITTAFMAVVVSALLKLILSKKYSDTFRQTITFGLLGGLIGMIVFFVAWYLKKQETNSWEAPGDISLIPFFSMMSGQLLGMFRLHKMKQKIEI